MRRRNLRNGACIAGVIGLASIVGGGLATVASASTSPSRAHAISASRCAANKAVGTITYVSPYGFDASAGIIDVFAAQSLGYFKQMCLTVNFVTNSFAATELVSAGRGTFTSIGSAADTLSEMANGANISAIATYGDTSDYAILTSPSIRSLKQLAGKTLGYKPPMPVVLSEMLQHTGVASSKVKEVAVGYDPNILPENKVQGLQVYRTNEPLTLTAEGKKYNEFIPSQFGVAGTFNTVVVNTTFFQKHAGATSDFLRAELHGFSFCAANVGKCIAMEARFAHASKQAYDIAHATQEWKLESKLAINNTLPGKGVGVESHAEWTPELRALEQAKLVKTVPALSKVENTALAASMYDGKQLIWPGA